MDFRELERVAVDVCTPRELDTIALITAGMTYREAAAQLGIGWSTAHQRVHSCIRRVVLARHVDDT